MEWCQTTLVKEVGVTTTLQESMQDVLTLLVAPTCSGSNMKGSHVLSVCFIRRGHFWSGARVGGGGGGGGGGGSRGGGVSSGFGSKESTDNGNRVTARSLCCKVERRVALVIFGRLGKRGEEQEEQEVVKDEVKEAGTKKKIGQGR